MVPVKVQGPHGSISPVAGPRAVVVYWCSGPVSSLYQLSLHSRCLAGAVGAEPRGVKLLVQVADVGFEHLRTLNHNAVSPLLPWVYPPLSVVTCPPDWVPDLLLGLPSSGSCWFKSLWHLLASTLWVSLAGPWGCRGQEGRQGTVARHPPVTTAHPHLRRGTEAACVGT